MLLDEAIKHCEEVAEEKENSAKEWHENQVRKCELISGTKMDYTHENECKKCAEEHRQLAEWLRDYKKLLEQGLIDKSSMMCEIYMKGVNMTGEYQGCWVRFKDIEKIVDKYIGGER